MDEREIEDWALRRDFEALTPAEQRMVVSRLGSREEYDRMRRTLSGARRAMADERARLIPDPAIAPDVREALAQRRARSAPRMPARRSLPGRAFTFRVPALGAGLVAAALAGIVFLVGPARRGDDVTHVVERLVTVHDTVRVATLDPALLRKITDSVHEEVHAVMAAERLAALRSARASEHRVAERTRRRNDDMHDDDGEEPSTESMETGRNQFVGLANLPRLNHQRRGKSLDEDSISKRFAVVMPRGN